MSSKVTFEQVDALAAQLSPREQLRLIEHTCQRLSLVIAQLPVIDTEEDRRRREKEADELLARLDATAATIEGEFDSAEEIRKMRAERDEQIWRSK
jgi:hypothetical protein